MGLFHSYLKEGKGVEKNELRPIRPLYFFQLFGRKFWQMCQLNLLYVLLTIPVWLVLWMFLLSDALKFEFSLQLVGELLSRIGLFFILFSWTIGPATAGITHVLKCYATETPAFLYAEFFEQFKKNFKQATLMSIINGVFVLSYAYTILGAQSPILLFGGHLTLGSMQGILLVLNILLIFMTYYVYTMMVTFELKFSDLIKFAFIFALAKLPLNIFVLILVATISYGAFAFMKIIVGVVLSAVIVYALCGFLVVFSIYPTIEKHMLIPAQKLEETKENSEI